MVTATNCDLRCKAAERPPKPPPTMTTLHGWLSGFVRAGFKLALVDIPTSLSQCRIRRRPRRFQHLPPPWLPPLAEIRRLDKRTPIAVGSTTVTPIRCD